MVKNAIIYFFIGGTLTSAIVLLEQSGLRLLSGFATLVPVFTVVSYFFIGDLKGGAAVGAHAKFVLVGTLVSWVPYMLAVAVLAPRIGTNKALMIGFAVFLILSLSFLFTVSRFGFFHE